MKKNHLNAFTLVELIVVISILTLISAASVFYFLDFSKNQEIKQKLSLIEEEFKILDKKVKEYEIFDYELNINNSSLNLGYYIYINNFDIDNNQTLSDLNTTTWSWIIQLNWIPSYTWSLKLYKKQKLFLNKDVNYNETINFDFNTHQNYKITSTLSWEILNEIHIKYFSNDNIDHEKNNLIVLTKISDTIWWSHLWDIKITNIWWNKIITDWTNEYNEIYLYFDNNWIEKFIKITK